MSYPIPLQYPVLQSGIHIAFVHALNFSNFGKYFLSTFFVYLLVLMSYYDSYRVELYPTLLGLFRLSLKEE